MGVRFSSLLPKLWVHKRLNSKALRSNLHRTFTVIAAAIITNWLFVRADRRRLGHNVDESAVLCVRCMKAVSLKV